MLTRFRSAIARLLVRGALSLAPAGDARKRLDDAMVALGGGGPRPVVPR